MSDLSLGPVVAIQGLTRSFEQGGVRIDVLRGGITGVKKTVNVCEAFGYRCEIHMSGIGNLHIMGSTSEDTCEYYERGLLAPGVDYDAPLEYLNTPLDAMDTEGYVHLPQRPGLGYDLNWDYIREHLIDDTGSVALGDWATN